MQTILGLVDTGKLIKKSLKNSRRAQLQLYDKYCSGMFTVALRYVKQTDIAEDVMQEAFIKAFEKLAEYDPQKNFGAWLKRITINQAIDQQRKEMPTTDFSEDVIQMHEAEYDEDWGVENKISPKIIQGCMKQLTDKDAIILKLFLLEGYDHEEISQILDQSNNASRTQLHRAKKRLKEQLKKRNDERFA